MFHSFSQHHRFIFGTLLRPQPSKPFHFFFFHLQTSSSSTNPKATMGLLDFTLKRLAPAAGATALAGFAGITTLNDDWDDYFHNSPAADPNAEPEKIVILGSGWAALSALRKCASPNKSIVVVSPRPHFLYTPLLASSSVGTITLRSA